MRDDFWDSSANLNGTFQTRGHVGLRENVTRKAPDHCPVEIQSAFEEGAVCLAVGCYNAAATMFRLCLDIATRGLLPDETVDGTTPAGPNRKQRRDLGLRIPWLIENGRLPENIKELAEVIREDANDGAHAGILGKEEAEDIADFTEVLLERLYTESGRVEAAKQRRMDRRAGVGATETDTAISD